jgi:ribonuclease D
VQLATDDKAYLFQIGAAPTPLAVLQAILESATHPEVGFGLADDVKRLRAKLGIEAANVLDLSTALRKPGERNDAGRQDRGGQASSARSCRNPRKSPPPTGRCRA